MKQTFIEKIERLAKLSLSGIEASIIAKMNSLSDKDIILALYRASLAGVKIEAIVRGICCLKPGVEGLSDNITVRSIIGNFLEHARAFVFTAGDEEEYYLGSADWMPRNLEKRVEVVFPVEDELIKKEIKHYLEIQLKDNVKSHIMQPDGSYYKPKTGKEKIEAQALLCEEARKSAKEE